MGFVFNVSLLSFFTYLAFVAIVWFKKPQLLITYFWYFVMASLSVVGVFACDFYEIDLTEISKISFYSNALSTFVFMYLLFFTPIFAGSSDWAEKGSKPSIAQPYGIFIAYLGLIVGLLLEVILFASIFNKPYFALGVNRTDYSSLYLSGWLSTIKGWLPLFLPCAIIIFKKRNKAIPLIFVALMFLIYVWVGDKFGTFVFAVAIIACCAIDPEIIIRNGLFKKIVLLFILACVALFIVGLAQRAFLYGEGVPEYLEYLFARLAQQGQIWWSVFDNVISNGVALDELPDALGASLTQETARSAPYAGQWKMMLVSSDYSFNTLARVETGVPYTTTTQASLFYYFSWFGVIAFPVLGIICKKIIDALIDAIRSGDCLVAMLFVKVIIAFNVLFTASELSALFSPTNLFVFALLIGLSLKSDRRVSELENPYTNRDKCANEIC